MRLYLTTCEPFTCLVFHSLISAFTPTLNLTKTSHDDIPQCLRCYSKLKQLISLLLWCHFLSFLRELRTRNCGHQQNEIKYIFFLHWETQLKRFVTKSQFNLNARKFVAFRVFTQNSFQFTFRWSRSLNSFRIANKKQHQTNIFRRSLCVLNVFDENSFNIN